MANIERRSEPLNLHGPHAGPYWRDEYNRAVAELQAAVAEYEAWGDEKDRLTAKRGAVRHWSIRSQDHSELAGGTVVTRFAEVIGPDTDGWVEVVEARPATDRGASADDETLVKAVEDELARTFGTNHDMGEEFLADVADGIVGLVTDHLRGAE